jgi:hypothetical protein
MLYGWLVKPSQGARLESGVTSVATGGFPRPQATKTKPKATKTKPGTTKSKSPRNEIQVRHNKIKMPDPSTNTGFSMGYPSIPGAGALGDSGEQPPCPFRSIHPHSF